jgi:hypothetical protein
MRNYLHKSLSKNDLEKSLTALISSPIRELKIFLIMTGLENQEDFDEFSALLSFIKQSMAASSRHLRVVLSATALVRFPLTPLEFEDAPLPAVLKSIVDTIRSLCETNEFEFRMSSSLTDYHVSQLLVRASDNRFFNALITATLRENFVFYRNIPHAFSQSFIDELAKAGIDTEKCLKSAKKSQKKTWHLFDSRVTNKFIAAQHANAANTNDIGYCLGSYDTNGSCKACGACTPEQKKPILAPRNKSTTSAIALKEKVKTWATDVCEVSVKVFIPLHMRGIPKPVLASALKSSIMTALPQTVPLFSAFTSSFFATSPVCNWITGNDVFTFRIKKQGFDFLQQKLNDKTIIEIINKKLEGRCTLLSISPQIPNDFTLAFSSPVAFTPENYFPRQGLTYTLKKDSGNKYTLEFSKQALKKNSIRKAWYGLGENGETKGELVVTAKFEIDEFIRQAFSFKNENDLVSICVEANF